VKKYVVEIYDSTESSTYIYKNGELKECEIFEAQTKDTIKVEADNWCMYPTNENPEDDIVCNFGRVKLIVDGDVKKEVACSCETINIHYIIE